ncbi:hypothetical protein FDA94_28805 [Herbidospora galbida]|uniref:Uncharacterized protein n=1 Tax=Herbidospora galbida TaxID=2575442 RepID=A0A4U3M8J4_9ACTN|nr:hypothetical protein [Herbidospora galbida]TKK84632.1 hypothetical protein FDA94_28805 [Herbidospora galbida]
MSESERERPDEYRTPIDEFIDKARRAQGLSWNELVEKARMTKSGLMSVRNGDTRSIRPKTSTGLDDALGLPRGTIEKVFKGDTAIDMSPKILTVHSSARISPEMAMQLLELANKHGHALIIKDNANTEEEGRNE